MSGRRGVIMLLKKCRLITRNINFLVLALASGFLTGEALAQVYKCAAGAGQTTNSDVPCEKIGAKPVGVVDTSPNEVSGLRRPTINTQTTVRQSTESSSRSQPQQNKPERDLDARRLREVVLNNHLLSMASTREQKEAARHEQSMISARGGVCKFIDDEARNRDGLYSDLGSIIAARRAEAKGPLYALLSSCQIM